VWTGSEMIVWGGRDGSLFFNTGGRYKPAAGTWTPTNSGTEVPSARASHTAVWTGSEMIVWGGSDGSLYFNTGGRYAPAGNLWAPTSTGASAPSARGDHSAVWTGSEMIVWGGRQTAASLATGARYCALPCSSLPPAGSPRLTLSRSGVTATLSWTALAGATRYDLVRGGLSPLRASGGNFTTATDACLADNTSLTSAADPSLSSPGDGPWYLVRGLNCGGNGTYDSGAASQAGSRDAEVNASSHACP
jgi:hypothetical protein